MPWGTREELTLVILEDSYGLADKGSELIIGVGVCQYHSLQDA